MLLDCAVQKPVLCLLLLLLANNIPGDPIKAGRPLLVPSPITVRKVNRFSNIPTLADSAVKLLLTKDPATPQTCRYITL